MTEIDRLPVGAITSLPDIGSGNISARKIPPTHYAVIVDNLPDYAALARIRETARERGISVRELVDAALAALAANDANGEA